jgi:hypothetical protein
MLYRKVLLSIGQLVKPVKPPGSGSNNLDGINSVASNIFLTIILQELGRVVV